MAPGPSQPSSAELFRQPLIEMRVGRVHREVIRQLNQVMSSVREKAQDLLTRTGRILVQ